MLRHGAAAGSARRGRPAGTFARWGLAAPPLILLMLLLGNNKRAVHRYRSGPISNVLVALACLLMTVLPLAYLIVR